MKWTTQKPTQSGWYWVGLDRNGNSAMVRLWFFGDFLVAEFEDGTQFPIELMKDTVVWAGPLMPPSASGSDAEGEG